MKKTILYLSIIFIFGFIFGLVNGFKIEFDKELLEVDKNKIQIFINTFTMNYWYLFLMCLFQNTYSFINLFILFGKGITLGISFGTLVRNKAIFGLGVYLFNFLGQYLILIPLMFIVMLVDFTTFNKRLSFTTIILVIYSFIISII